MNAHEKAYPMPFFGCQCFACETRRSCGYKDIHIDWSNWTDEDNELAQAGAAARKARLGNPTPSTAPVPPAPQISSGVVGSTNAIGSGGGGGQSIATSAGVWSITPAVTTTSAQAIQSIKDRGVSPMGKYYYDPVTGKLTDVEITGQQKPNEDDWPEVFMDTKPTKPIHETTLDDYRRGIEKLGDKYNRY